MASPPSLHNNIGFDYSIHLIKPDPPPRKSYHVHHSLSTPAPADAREALFQAIKMVKGPEETSGYARRQLLIVKCKRPAADTPEIWEETVCGQFLGDISTFITNTSQRVFGAIAIGTFDLRTENGVEEVEKMLDYIKAEGWDWANSESEIEEMS
ncbi:uncharacterized protein N7483_008562 [Penicillium malachiteum]|uniref:uncharacterized protein n=1 Tax=Penicillium malachiteum TaxID=1324776 RepID=UPI002547617F|nr:uncharacterized protein N7483_008562 [Penicillium malachiteum]KAJ5720628.1 hypothetical protein N7483_008562 [Penicillium malachiteum]